MTKSKGDDESFAATAYLKIARLQLVMAFRAVGKTAPWRIRELKRAQAIVETVLKDCETVERLARQKNISTMQAMLVYLNVEAEEPE